MIEDADEPTPGARHALLETPDLAGMDARVLAAYRREFGARRRFWGRPLRVPRPVAALVILGLLVCATLALRGRSPEGQALSPEENATARDPRSVQSVRQDLPVRGDLPVVTNTSLEGFEPVDEMEVVAVGGGQ
jgi:hypothetical protein